MFFFCIWERKTGGGALVEGKQVRVEAPNTENRCGRCAERSKVNKLDLDL